MAYSIILAVLIVTALILYFVLNRKLKTPTIVTELLLTKYNKKVDKLNLFFKKNQIDIDVLKFKSSVEKKDISWQAIKHNLLIIEKIKANALLIDNILSLTKKQEVLEQAKFLHAPCNLYEFAEELNVEKKTAQLFEVLGIRKTKLDFEQQRYFGSQFFYDIDGMFVYNFDNEVLLVDNTNIFNCKVVDFKVNIEEIEKNQEGKVFQVRLFLGEKLVDKKVLVPQKEVIKFLQNYNKI